jgi:hypothetical protein
MNDILEAKRTAIPVIIKKDGLYRVKSLRANQCRVAAESGEALVTLSEASEDEYQVLHGNVLIESGGYIPLETEGDPEPGPFSKDSKTILITLSEDAFYKARKFFSAAKKIKTRVVLVVQQQAFLAEVNAQYAAAPQLLLVCPRESSYKTIFQLLKIKAPTCDNNALLAIKQSMK